MINKSLMDFPSPSMDKRDKYLIGVFILLGSFIILWFSHHYSFTWTDECFYYSTVHRLIQGDRLFVDDWSPTQFYAPLLIPFCRLFPLEGIILNGRRIALIIHTFVACSIYRSFRNTSPWKAIIVSLLFQWYLKGGGQGLSYYILCLDFYTLGTLLIYHHANRRTSMFVAGIFFSLATLCNPFISILYLGVSLLLLVLHFMKRNIREKWLYILYGSILSGVCYILWLSRSVSPAQIFSNIPNLFLDPEYENSKFVFTPIHYFKVMFKRYIVFLPFVFICWISLVLGKIRNNTTILKYTWFFQHVLACIMFIKYQSFVPFVLLISASFIVLPGTTGLKRTDFLFVFVPGICLSYCFYLASNTGLDAMNIGFCVSMLPLPFVIGEVLDSFNIKRSFILVLVMCILLGFQFISRFTQVYRDGKWTSLSQTISTGPAKGLKTTEVHATQYYQVMHNIELLIEKYPKDTVLFSQMLPWGYLMMDRKYPGVSTWRVLLNDPRNKLYYIPSGMHPYPDIVVVVGDSYPIYNKPPREIETSLIRQGRYTKDEELSELGWEVYRKGNPLSGSKKQQGVKNQ